MGARRASASAVVAVVGGVLLITLLVAWAAAIGPSEVLRGDGPTAERLPDTPTTTATTSAPTDPLENLEENHPPRDSLLIQVLAVVLQLLLVGGLVLVLILAARLAWQTRLQRDRPEPRSEDIEFDVLDQPEELARELSDGAPAQRAMLSSGTPRNAIVEVWNRFETLAGNAGSSRLPWETSSEFTLRVLEAVDADSSAVAQLAGLYREARFSDHELTEEHRAAAVAALEVIHAGLTAGRRAGLT